MRHRSRRTVRGKLPWVGGLTMCPPRGWDWFAGCQNVARLL